MASNINTETLDALYPVAGVDNDSQGFRDNFFNIKTNLDHASTELTDLQNGVARIDGDNNFAGNTIEGADLLAVTERLNASFAQGVPADPIDAAQTSVECSFEEGHIYDVQAITELLEVTVTDFPQSKYGKVRLILSSVHTAGDFGPGEGTQVTLSAGTGTLKTNGSPFSGAVLAVAQNQDVIVDVFSYDQGNTVYAQYVGTFTAVP